MLSVIIPCYNHGRHVAGAVSSVLSQRGAAGTEVIVVDDGSTDDTAEVVRRLGPDVRYLRQRNAGLSAARNAGILAAGGEFVHFLDADDWLLPGAVDRHLAAAAREPAADVFYGGWCDVDADGRWIADVDPGPFAGDAVHRVLSSNIGVCHCFTVRRSAFARTGLFDTSLNSVEDWDMWIRLAAAGCRYVHVPGIVGAYRRSPGSMSRNYRRMWVETKRVLRKNARHHGDCDGCRRAVRAGLAAHRRYFVEPGLWSEAEAAAAAGRPWIAIRAAFTVARLDPGSVRFAAHVARYHISGWAKQRLMTGWCGERSAESGRMTG
ncbi:MAG TPA: glycosyltransferase [Humisphaera sp.]